MADRTIFFPEVPFPMKDPYGPVVRAGIPVPGLTRWPGREMLGRHYYGVDTDETPQNNTTTLPGMVKAFNAEPVTVVNAGDSEVAGFAGFADSVLVDLGLESPTPVDPAQATGGIDWAAIINAGIHTAPAIIQAAEGGGTPNGFYNAGSPVSQIIPAGYTRNSAGQLIPISSAGQLAGGLGVAAATGINSISTFVQKNPLVILGAGLAVMLLFMKPPSRR
jgi:hypothetical protein